MITESDVEEIKRVIDMQIDLGDEFEGTSESFYLQENFNDIENLPIFHEMLTSNLPSTNLHIFSFIKIEYFITNFSGEWSFNEFDRINRWIIDYIDTFSDFLMDGPKLLFESLVGCYLELVRTATAKYPYFQDFWNSMAHFTSTVDSNTANVSFISLFILRKLFEMKDEENEEKEETEKIEKRKVKSKSDIQMKENRLTVFTYSMRILEINYGQEISETESNLAELSLNTALSFSELVRSSNFRIFFAYSNALKGNEDALRLCEVSLAEGKDEIDGSENEIDTDAVLAVEEGIVVEGDEIENKVSLAVGDEKCVVYYTRFLETMRKRKAYFSPSFLSNLELFASDFFVSGLLNDSPEAVLNLASFFALYEGYGYEKPSEHIRDAFFKSALDSASSDAHRFSEAFSIGSENEERITSLICLMFRFTFPEFIFTFKEEVSAIFESKKDHMGQKEKEKNSVVLSLYVRVAEQSLRKMLNDKTAESFEDLVNFVISLHSDFIIPTLEEQSEGVDSELHFSDYEILSFLMFDRFLVEADEFSVTELMSIDEYSDAIRILTQMSHATLACVGSDSSAASASIAVLAAACEKKSDIVFIDNDWMLEEQRQIEFDVSTNAGFHTCAAFNECLFFHELKQVQPRINVFFAIAERGINALIESLNVSKEEPNDGQKENVKLTEEEEIEKEREEKGKRFLFFKILANISGLLHAFEKFCSQNVVEKSQSLKASDNIGDEEEDENKREEEENENKPEIEEIDIKPEEEEEEEEEDESNQEEVDIKQEDIIIEEEEEDDSNQEEEVDKKPEDIIKEEDEDEESKQEEIYLKQEVIIIEEEEEEDESKQEEIYLKQEVIIIEEEEEEDESKQGEIYLKQEAIILEGEEEEDESKKEEIYLKQEVIILEEEEEEDDETERKRKKAEKQRKEKEKKRKEERKRKEKESKRKIEEKKRKIEERKRKIEDKKREEEEKKREEEDKRRKEEERKREEENKKREEEERKRKEEERKRKEEERKRKEEERKRKEEERKRKEEERKREEENKKREEEERKRKEEERKREEEDKKRKEEVFNDDEYDNLNDRAVSHGTEIAGFIFTETFDALVSLAEEMTKSGEDELTTSHFAIFGARIGSLLRRQFFEVHSTVPIHVFKSLASFACKAIGNLISRIRSANNEEDGILVESGDEYERFRMIRMRSRSILASLIRMSASLLGSDVVPFGAFLLYEDTCYSELVFAAAAAFDMFSIDSVIEDKSGDEFSIKSATESLLSSIYSIHIPIIAQKPGFEQFDDFFIVSMQLVGNFDGGLRLLETLVRELAKIFLFNNGACEPYLAASELLFSLVSSVFDEAFLNKNSDVGSSRLFGRFACISEGFAGSLMTRVLDCCPMLKRPIISKILNEIIEASEKHDFSMTRELFEKFHSTWFNL